MTTTEPTAPEATEPTVLTPSADLQPASLFTPTPKAAKRVLEFFTAQINNDHTGKAQVNATRRFAEWCDPRGIAGDPDGPLFRTAAARAKAEAIASALGVKIKRTVSAEEIGEGMQPMAAVALGAQGRLAAPTTPIEPGTIEMRVHVTLTVEISAETPQ